MQAVFKPTDELDWRTMHLLKKAIKRYSGMDPAIYGDMLKEHQKRLANFMRTFFPDKTEETK